MRPATRKLSVLMPVFNTADYLEEALKSISLQSYADFEFIVINDGSTDRSAEVLAKYAQNEPRLTVVSRENRGLIATRNELLERANGELIAWMDSDDIASPDRLKVQITCFNADSDLICLGGVAQCIDPTGNPLNIEIYPLTHKEILLEQQKGGAMRFPTTMMRRDAVIQVGGFREPFRIGEDFDLLLRLSEIGKMQNLPDTIYLYRQHLKSVCATLGPQWFAYRDQILALAHERRDTGMDRLQKGATVSIPKYESNNHKKLEEITYIRWSNAALQNKNRKLASKYAKAAIAVQPYSREAWKSLARVFLNKPRQ